MAHRTKKALQQKFNNTLPHSTPDNQYNQNQAAAQKKYLTENKIIANIQKLQAQINDHLRPFILDSQGKVTKDRVQGEYWHMRNDFSNSIFRVDPTQSGLHLKKYEFFLQNSLEQIEQFQKNQDENTKIELKMFPNNQKLPQSDSSKLRTIIDSYRDNYGTHLDDYYDVRGIDKNIRYRDGFIDSASPFQVLQILYNRVIGLNICGDKSKRHESGKATKYYFPEHKREYSVFKKYFDDTLIQELNKDKPDESKFDKDKIQGCINELLQVIALGPDLLQLYRDIKDEPTKIQYQKEVNQFLTENPKEKALLCYMIPHKFINDGDGLLKLEYFTEENIAKYRHSIYGFGADYDMYKKKTAYGCLYQVDGVVAKIGDTVCHNYVDWCYHTNDLMTYISVHKNKDDPDVTFPLRFLLPNEDSHYLEGDRTKFILYGNKPLDVNTLLQNNIIGLILMKFVYESKTQNIKVFVVYENTTGLRTNFEADASDQKYRLVNIQRQPTFPGLFMGMTAVTVREWKQFTQYYDFIRKFKYKTEKHDVILMNVNNEPKTNISMSNIVPVTIEKMKDKVYSIIGMESQNKIGGGNETLFKLKTSKTHIPVHNSILGGVFYKTFIDRNQNQKHWQLDRDLVQLSKYYYPYLPVSGNYYLFFQEFNKQEIQIPKYRPLFNKYFECNEVYHLYLKDIIKDTSKITILGQDYSLVELCIANNYKINDIHLYLPKKISLALSNLNQNIYQIYNKKINIIAPKINIINSDEYNYFNENIEKSDCFLYNVYNLWDCLNYFEQSANIPNLLSGLICGLKYTKVGGCFVLYLYSIVNKPIADIYLIGKKYFKESHLYYPEITNSAKRSGSMAIYKGFKGISSKELQDLINMILQIEKIYPNGVSDFNVYDSEVRQQFNITKTITQVKPYITGLLDTKVTSKDYGQYQEIVDFNNNRYLKQLNFIHQIYQGEEIGKYKDSDIPTDNQIQKSVLYCRKWDIEYFPHFQKGSFDDKMGREIMAELFGLLKPYDYEFKTPYQNYVVSKMSLGKLKSVSRKKGISKKTKTKSFMLSHSSTGNKTKSKSRSNSRKSRTKNGSLFMDLLEDFDSVKVESDVEAYRRKVSLSDEIFPGNNWIEQTNKMIDTRRDFTKEGDNQIEKYYQINILFRFYKYKTRGKINNLAVEARKITGNDNISQAWLKMYEILADTKLINKRKGTLRSFHLCEAPGSFIDCLNYYIRTKTNIDKFEWNAQSLKPIKSKIIGDSFGIIKRHPKRWHWGADGTGDITNIDNIKYYKQFCDGINLITSDCGLAWKDTGYEKVAYSSLVAILYLLPKGANMVFKILSPVDIPLVWNVIYIYYQNFKKLHFFKPTQNFHSREFYVIGIDYLGTESKVLNKLFYHIKHFNEKTDLLDDMYPEPFVRQVGHASNHLAKIWTYTIQKQLYYQDHLDYLPRKFIEIGQKYVDEKNKEWLKRYKLKYLESKYYL